MALYDASGTATGSAVISAAPSVLYSVSESLGGAGDDPLGIFHLLIGVEGTIVGSGSTSAMASMPSMSVSGMSVGSGTLSDGLTIDVEALLDGSSVVSGSAQMTFGAFGYAAGQGSFLVSWPEPIVGQGILVGYADVVRYPRPVYDPPPAPPAFRWGHVFGPGDLELCLSDAKGNPFSPGCVTFTLYQILKGCSPRQVGPSGRTPVNYAVGSYYATGIAGECGQPGLWMLRWSYRKSFGGPMVSKDCYFQVLDSVLCPVPGDTLQRSCKYGWD